MLPRGSVFLLRDRAGAGSPLRGRPGSGSHLQGSARAPQPCRRPLFSAPPLQDAAYLLLAARLFLSKRFYYYFFFPWCLINCKLKFTKRVGKGKAERFGGGKRFI